MWINRINYLDPPNCHWEIRIEPNWTEFGQWRSVAWGDEAYRPHPYALRFGLFGKPIGKERWIVAVEERAFATHSCEILGGQAFRQPTRGWAFQRIARTRAALDRGPAA